MQALPLAFATELDSDAHAGLARCVAIGIATPVYRTLWNEPVTFDGITYEPDDFEFGEVIAATVPDSPSLQFRIRNIRDPVTDDERPWSIVLGQEDVRGKALTLRIVSTALLADATAKIEHEWTIRKAGIRGTWCEMELGLPADLARMWLPWPQIRSQRCTHEYKDGLCRSSSQLATCGKIIQTDCPARHPASALRASQLPYDTDMRRRD